MSDENVQALLREAEERNDSTLWAQAARKLLRLERLDEAGRAAARVVDLVERAALLDMVVPDPSTLHVRELGDRHAHGHVTSPAWSHDERTLYVSTGRARAREVLTLSTQDGEIQSRLLDVSLAHPSPTGREIAFGNPLRVRDVTTNSWVPVIDAPELGFVRFAPDGEGLVVSTERSVDVYRRREETGFTRERRLDARWNFVDASGTFVTVSDEMVSLHEPIGGTTIATLDMFSRLETAPELASLPSGVATRVLRAVLQNRKEEATQVYAAATGATPSLARTVIEEGLRYFWFHALPAGLRVFVISPQGSFLFDQEGHELGRAKRDARRGDFLSAVDPSPSGRLFAWVDWDPLEAGGEYRARLIVRAHESGPSRVIDLGDEPLETDDPASSIAWAPSGRRLAAAVAPDRIYIIECANVVEP